MKNLKQQIHFEMGRSLSGSWTHWTFTLSAFVLVCLSGHVAAQQTNTRTNLSETTMVGRLDAGLIDVLMKELPPTADSQETVLHSRLRKTKEILQGEKIWMTSNWPRIPTNIHLAVADEKRVKQLSELWNCRDQQLYKSRTCTVSLRSIQSEKQLGLSDNLKKMLPNLPAGATSFSLQPPKHLYRILNELVDELPDYLGGGPIEILTEGALSANISLDPGKSSIDGFIQSKNGVAANELKNRLPKLISSFIDHLSPDDNEAIKNILQQVANDLAFSVENDRIRIKCKVQDMAKLTREAANALVGPIESQSQLEKLREAALGILNYESANGFFPPPADKDGVKNSGLSWRVHILPFVGEYKLWQKFKLDEPWDSPANKKLLPEMPVIYSGFSSHLTMPADAPKGMTTMLAPYSENTILGSPKKVTFGSITDGSSNTVLLVIVDPALAVPWTAPKDYAYDPKKPADGLKFDNEKTPVVMCDGSHLSAKRENPWKFLFEMNEGNVAQIK